VDVAARHVEVAVAEGDGGHAGALGEAELGGPAGEGAEGAEVGVDRQLVLPGLGEEEGELVHEAGFDAPAAVVAAGLEPAHGAEDGGVLGPEIVAGRAVFVESHGGQGSAPPRRASSQNNNIYIR